MTTATTASAATMATTTTKISLERKTCTRCGGSGRYSHCTMYGDTCFKCNGKGKVLTAAGARALAAINAYKMEHYGKTIEDIVVGDRIMVDGYRHPKVVTATATGIRRWLRRRCGTTAQARWTASRT